MKDYLSKEELEKIFIVENDENFTMNEFQENLCHPVMFDKSGFETIIVNKVLNSNILRGKKISGAKFINCLFLECNMKYLMTFVCTFESCDFVECDLEGSVFRKSDIQNSIFHNCQSRFSLNFSEGNFFNVIFDKCNLYGLEISGAYTEFVKFVSSNLNWGRFQVLITSNFDDQDLARKNIVEIEEDEIELKFDECTISFMNFMMNNMVDSKFTNCKLERNNFNECILFNHNFVWDNYDEKFTLVNNIDVTSLHRSQILNKTLLKRLFNLSSNMQNDIKTNQTPKNLSSVFISYSLKDSEIAEKINAKLKVEGVKTFLWAEDAPGGKKLSKIMKSNIESKDRILFIASKNSLKSKACHFELTKGRELQNKSWKTILFPIHIDNFLFEIEEDEIPLDYRKDFWKNIVELKEINSIDFSALNENKALDEERNERIFENLINSLRK